MNNIDQENSGERSHIIIMPKLQSLKNYMIWWSEFEVDIVKN